MHLNDEQVAALVHDNMASPVIVIGAITHESSCRQCSERVEMEQAIDAFAGQMLCVIDHEVPMIAVRNVIRRARVRAARRAVLVLILVAVGATAASAAIPGTPVHTLLMRVRGHSEPAAPVESTPPNAVAPAPRPQSNTISIIPNRALDVVLPSVSRGSVNIRLTDSGTATLSSSDPNVAYTLEENRIVVRSLSTAAEYELSLPGALQSVRVASAGRMLYRREDGITRCTGTESVAGCLVDFGPSHR